MSGGSRLETGLRNPRRGHGPALMPYLTAGFPRREGFAELLRRVAQEADAIELGVPFTDPMADGVSIQAASRAALADGVTLRWILEMLDTSGVAREVPLSLMSYLNPLLAYGFEALVRDAAAVGVCGLIVPDLPFEECAPLRDPADAAGVALVQLVTPVTPPHRRDRLCAESRGFVYAVTMTGTTGGTALAPDVGAYLDGVRAGSALPVCAGFGIRRPEHVAALRPHADGVIVGSALVDVLRDGGDPVAFLRSLSA